MNLDVQDYDLSVITHCNAIILIFLDWFHWIRKRLCGWWADFTLSTAVVHITVTSVKVCLLLNEVNCFCVVWNDTVPQSFNVFCDSKRFLCFISLKINIYAFLGYFIFLLLVFCKIMQKIRYIVLLMYCGVGESVTSLNCFMNTEVLPYFKTMTKICNCIPYV